MVIRKMDLTSESLEVIGRQGVKWWVKTPNAVALIIQGDQYGTQFTN